MVKKIVLLLLVLVLLAVIMNETEHPVSTCLLFLILPYFHMCALQSHSHHKLHVYLSTDEYGQLVSFTLTSLML